MRPIVNDLLRARRQELRWSYLLSVGILLAGLIARGRGEAAGRLDEARNLERSASLGAMFFVGAVGVAGLPPLAGFAAKLYILQSALSTPAASWVLGVVLVSGLLVIVALSRAGSALFWRTGAVLSAAAPASAMTSLPAALLLLGTVVLMIAAGPVTAFTQATAAQLADRSAYVGAVTANRGVSIPASWREEP